MGSCTDSTFANPVAQSATAPNTPGRRDNAGRELRSGGHPPAHTSVAPIDPEIPEFDGATLPFPPIPGFQCHECGAKMPGGGVNRQSQVECRPGIRRGGKCRSCRTVATRAARAFDAAATAHLAKHARGGAHSERAAEQAEAIRIGRLAQWQVLVAAAKRAARRTAKRVAA